MAALYSRVDRGVWNSVDFRSLTRLEPTGQALWLYLLTCPHHTAFPGLFVASFGTIGDDLEWDRSEVKRCFDELIERGMARIDTVTRLVWLPKALARRMDEARSAKNVRGWRSAWENMPRCTLRDEAYAAAAFAIKEGGSVEAVESFGSPSSASSEALPKPSGMGLPSPSEALPKPSGYPFDLGRGSGSGSGKEKEREIARGAAAPSSIAAPPQRFRSESEKQREVDEVMSNLLPHLSAFGASTEDDLRLWLTGILSTLKRPIDVPALPFIPLALADLFDAVGAEPAMIGSRRLKRFRQALEYKLLDDSNDGWRFGRSGGTDGRLAPKAIVRAGASKSQTVADKLAPSKATTESGYRVMPRRRLEESIIPDEPPPTAAVSAVRGTDRPSDRPSAASPLAPPSVAKERGAASAPIGKVAAS